MASSGDQTPGGRRRRRHRFYGQLLLICLLSMVTFTLPLSLKTLGIVVHVLLVAVLVNHLGQPGAVPGSSRGHDRVYRALGIGALAAQLLWWLTPLSLTNTGVPLLVLWTLFVGWSTGRLVRLLALETEVNGRVLMGAAAGFLMLGLAAGLLMGVLETVEPGSFTSVHNEGGRLLEPRQLGRLTPQMIWQLDFARLNYFAFITLTTTGYGDVLPVTQAAQLTSVMVAVIGQIYLAVVMGVLISRFTLQEAEEDEERKAAPAPGVGEGPPEH